MEVERRHVEVRQYCPGLNKFVTGLKASQPDLNHIIHCINNETHNTGGNQPPSINQVARKIFDSAENFLFLSQERDDRYALSLYRHHLQNSYTPGTFQEKAQEFARLNDVEEVPPLEEPEDLPSYFPFVFAADLKIKKKIGKGSQAECFRCEYAGRMFAYKRVTNGNPFYEFLVGQHILHLDACITGVAFVVDADSGDSKGRVLGFLMVYCEETLYDYMNSHSSSFPFDSRAFLNTCRSYLQHWKVCAGRAFPTTTSRAPTSC